MYSTIEEVKEMAFNAGFRQGSLQSALEWVRGWEASEGKWSPMLEEEFLDIIRMIMRRVERDLKAGRYTAVS